MHQHLQQFTANVPQYPKCIRTFSSNSFSFSLSTVFVLYPTQRTNKQATKQKEKKEVKQHGANRVKRAQRVIALRHGRGSTVTEIASRLRAREYSIYSQPKNILRCNTNALIKLTNCETRNKFLESFMLQMTTHLYRNAGYFLGDFTLACDYVTLFPVPAGSLIVSSAIPFRFARPVAYAG